MKINKILFKIHPIHRSHFHSLSISWLDYAMMTSSLYFFSRHQEKTSKKFKSSRVIHEDKKERSKILIGKVDHSNQQLI